MRKRDHHHDAVAGDLERAELEIERIDVVMRVRTQCQMPGRVPIQRPRESAGCRAARGPSRCARPGARRQAPAAAIIAALSVLSRGRRHDDADRLPTGPRTARRERAVAGHAAAEHDRGPRRSSSTARGGLGRPALERRVLEPAGQVGPVARPGRRCRTARSTAVLRPLNEKSKRCGPWPRSSGRGNSNRPGVPVAASRSIAGPPGYPSPSRVATLSNASPAASSRVWPSSR